MQATGGTSVEDVALLQRRVALFGRLGAILAAVALVLAYAPMLVHQLPLPPAALALHVMAALFLGGVWLACRTGTRSLGFLRTLDAAMVVISAACFGLMATRLPAFTRPDLLMALIHAQIIVMRAVLVPSTARRTLIISVVAGVPLFVIAWVTQRELAATGADAGGHLSIVELESESFVWLVTNTAVATTTSSIIYGLRRQVRKAMELGQYTLLEKLGEGGMGQVFRARHAMLRRPTAVKLLHAETDQDLARFEREVQLTAQLTHPNTITVFDYGKTPDGVFYYAMELLDGADLQKIVDQSGPMPAARVVHVLAQVADALAEAHAIGLIHRDIKPANIILCSRGTLHDVAKVVDFGLVKSTKNDADVAVSAANTVLGTPLYMAPESIRTPDDVDARTDVYALGAVGYFLLTGTPVFVGTSLVAIFSDHLHAPPIPPSKRLGESIDADLEALVLACLAKSPADRPASALVLRDRLRACAAAGKWSEADAAKAWKGIDLTSETRTSVTPTAATIAVDLDQRSPKAATMV
jgi:eukaryotic-like serine/threonine-protein kinase